MSPINNKEEALAIMQRAAEEASGALGEVCMVLDEIALDLSFARHANRTPLRLSSDRLERISRALIGEARACGAVGAKHLSIVGKAALASATISVLPFAEDAGHIAMNRFKASHERATTNLDLVFRYAESAQSETRKDVGLQIGALVGELDELSKEVGAGLGEQRRELEEAMNKRELAASWALDGLDRAIQKVHVDARQNSASDDGSRLLGLTGSPWERLAEIEFKIAEIFALLTGDAPV